MTNSPVDLLYLPDDLLLNCLARIPRLYYPILSLVSKKFRSLLTSLELYDIRTLLGCTENCLYVSLRLSSESKPRWFTLCRKPTPIPDPNPNPSRNPNSRWFTPCFRPYKILKIRTRNEENNSSEKFMVSVPIRNDCPQFGLTSTSGTTIGSNIYILGGHIDGAVSSRVFILDCRSHTWHEAPRMQMSRKCPLVSVLDGKIYVVDRKNVAHPSNLIEFFNPKIQIWEHVPIPSEELRGIYITRSLVLGEKLYLFGYKSTVYKPKEQIWDVVGLEKCLRWVRNSSSCVIDNVVYTVLYRRIICYDDTEGRSWRFLKGLKTLPKLPKRYRYIRLVDCGGKIAVLWEKKVRAIGSNKKMIWCAEIALERRNAQEIYGKIEWCNVVLTVPKSCSLLQFNAVTL